AEGGARECEAKTRVTPGLAPGICRVAVTGRSPLVIARDGARAGAGRRGPYSGGCAAPMRSGWWCAYEDRVAGTRGQPPHGPGPADVRRAADRAARVRGLRLRARLLPRAQGAARAHPHGPAQRRPARAPPDRRAA